MKKIILSSVLLGFLAFPFLALAQTQDLREQLPDAHIPTVIETMTEIVFGVFLAFAAIMIIIAAFQFLTAGGDTTKITAAREKVLYAIIGIVVAFLARAIINFIRGLI